MADGSANRWSPGSLIFVAGWLFADLMLVLFLVGMANTTVPKPVPTPVAASASPSPSPSPSPRRSASTKPVLVLNAWKATLTVSVGGLLDGSEGANRALIATFQAALRRDHQDHRQAGLILTFGVWPTPGGNGERLAGIVNNLVKERLPGFANVVTRQYWRGGGSGTVQVEVFFFASQ